MLEDLPCALTPTERKILTTSLAGGWVRQSVTGVTLLLVVVGAVASLALFCLVELWHHGLGSTSIFLTAYLCSQSMVRRRDSLIKKLYDCITSTDGTDLHENASAPRRANQSLQTDG